MTKEEKTIEIAVKTLVDKNVENYSKDLIVSAEILRQIRQKGFIFDYTKFSLNDQEMVSDIGYNISSIEKKESNEIEEELEDELIIDGEFDEELGEFYCRDDIIEFDSIEDLFAITDKSGSLHEIVSTLSIPKVIIGNVAYCYNGKYYRIVDIGVNSVVLSIAEIEESELDELFVELLENQL